MDINWEMLLFALLFIDSVGAVVMSWFGQRWWMQATGRFSKFFPPAKGWSLLYLVLVLVIGHLMGVI